MVQSTFCFPHFDSPTIFAALLDHARGGRFQIAPQLADTHQKQLYLPDSNILLTRFLAPEEWQRSRTSCRWKRWNRPITWYAASKRCAANSAFVCSARHALTMDGPHTGLSSKQGLCFFLRGQ